MAEFESPEITKMHRFEVEKIPAGEGFSYVVYFPTEDDAAKAITDFWSSRLGSEMTVRGIQSGMLNPKNPKHIITSGDRTRINTADSVEQQKHPGMTYKVWFNGNEGAISSRGKNALIRIGFVEGEI